MGSVGLMHLTLKETLRNRSYDLYGKTECVTCPPQYCCSFFYSLLVILLSCALWRILQTICPHKDIRSLPTQWFSPRLMAKAVFLEQSWCRWTVCLSVSVCVGLVLITTLSGLGAFTCVGFYVISVIPCCSLSTLMK